MSLTPVVTGVKTDNITINETIDGKLQIKDIDAVKKYRTFIAGPIDALTAQNIQFNKKMVGVRIRFNLKTERYGYARLYFKLNGVNIPYSDMLGLGAKFSGTSFIQISYFDGIANIDYGIDLVINKTFEVGDVLQLIQDGIAEYHTYLKNITIEPLREDIGSLGVELI